MVAGHQYLPHALGEMNIMSYDMQLILGLSIKCHLLNHPIKDALTFTEFCKKRKFTCGCINIEYMLDLCDKA